MRLRPCDTGHVCGATPARTVPRGRPGPAAALRDSVTGAAGRARPPHARLLQRAHQLLAIILGAATEARCGGGASCAHRQPCNGTAARGGPGEGWQWWAVAAAGGGNSGCGSSGRRRQRAAAGSGSDTGVRRRQQAALAVGSRSSSSVRWRQRAVAAACSGSSGAVAAAAAGGGSIGQRQHCQKWAVPALARGGNGQWQ